MEKSIYKIDCKLAIIEVFKLLDVDELTADAYKIIVTNKETNESDFVTTNTPQGAIALADQVRDGL